MSDTNLNRRRRHQDVFAEHANLPRSRTSPALGSDSDPANWAGDVHTGPGASVATSRNVSSPSMNFYPPFSGHSTNFSLPSQPRASQSTSSLVPVDSPRPKTATTTSTASTGKEDYGGFNFKSESSDEALLTPPLPTVAPIKAARMLGLDTDISPDDNDSKRVDKAAHVRRGLMKKMSMPSLKPRKVSGPRKADFTEDVEINPPKGKKFWGSGRMRDLFSGGSSSKRAEEFEPKATLSHPPHHQEQDLEHASESESDVRSPIHQHLAESPPSRASLRQPARNKARRPVDKMGLIHETPQGQLGVVDHRSERQIKHTTGFEYAESRYPKAITSKLPHAMFQPGPTREPGHELSHNPFESAAELPAEDVHDATHSVHPGTKVDLDSYAWRKDPTRDPGYELSRNPFESAVELPAEDVYSATHSVDRGTQVDLDNYAWRKPSFIQSERPLQATGSHVLDAAELELDSQRTKLDVMEADKLKIDVEVAGLSESDRQTCRALEAFKLKEDVDSVSIRSSIDLDEEPTVHEARMVTFTRILPGQVKLVDIPPRKKAPTSTAEMGGSAAPSPAVANSPLAKPDENIQVRMTLFVL